MNILLLDRSENERETLEVMITGCLDPPPSSAPVFYGFEPRDVFEFPMPKDIHATFITIGSMTDVEAARQYAKVYGEIPLVAVSDSEEYSIECYRFNVRRYLKRPISKEELTEALRQCNVTSLSY